MIVVIYNVWQLFITIPNHQILTKIFCFNVINLQKRMYCVCNVLHWFCFKVCRLCLVYTQYKLPCVQRRNNSRKLQKVYSSYLRFSGAHHVETCSLCFPIFRCVTAKEHTWLEKKLQCTWLEKKLRQDTKMFVMQCWYISLNTSLNELTGRNKTLVEEYHVKLSRKYLLISRLFRLLRKRLGISGKYINKKRR